MLLATLRTNVSDSMSEKTLASAIVVGDASSSTITSAIEFATVGASFIGRIVTLNTSETDNAGLVPTSVAVTVTSVEL